MIINNRRNKGVRFDAINNGEVFALFDGNNIYMKIEETYCNNCGDYENAVSLEDGSLHYISENSDVEIIKCELVID